MEVVRDGAEVTWSEDRGTVAMDPGFSAAGADPVGGGLLKKDKPPEKLLLLSKAAGMEGGAPTEIPAPGAKDDNAAFIRFPTPDPLRSEREVRFSDVGKSSPRAFRATCEANID